MTTRPFQPSDFGPDRRIIGKYAVRKDDKRRYMIVAVCHANPDIGDDVTIVEVLHSGSGTAIYALDAFVKCFELEVR